MIEINRRYITSISIYFVKPEHDGKGYVVLYSSYSDDDLIQKFIEAACLTMISYPILLIPFKNRIPFLPKKVSPSKIYNTLPTTSYEFVDSEKKKYILNIFKLYKCKIMPTGLSTAYLNSKKGFKSFGFLKIYI